MKGRKILGWTVGVLAALYTVAYVACFQTTLPIEGVIVDAKTGKPVEKVLVRCYWHFSQSNPVDTTGAEKGFGTVTDANGRFKIPRKNVTIVLGRFDDQYVWLQHPLYAFQEQQVYSTFKNRYVVGTPQEGILKLTLPMTSLEDKYSRVEDINKLADAIEGCGPEFYRVLRDRYKIRYELDAVMTELERLASRFPGIPPEKNYAYRAFKAHQFKMREILTTY